MEEIRIIDAHHHLCRLSQASYPWLEGPAVSRYHGDDSSLRRDYLIDDYRSDVGELRELNAQVVASVHVENGAADPRAEALWIHDVIAQHTLPSVQVARVRLDSPLVEAELEAISKLASVRGVRDILNTHPDSYYAHRESDLLNDRDWRHGFSMLGPLGLSFDLQVFPHQLADAACLAADHGDVPIVLDHVGMPIDRSPAGLSQWRRQLAIFASEPNTMAKISALGTLDHGWTKHSIDRIVLDTIDAFGPDRCMFGSNFPVDGLYCRLADLYTAFCEITADLRSAERSELFAGTARRFYRIEDMREQGLPGDDSF